MILTYTKLFRCVTSMIEQSVANELSKFEQCRAELAKLANESLKKTFDSDEEAAEFILNDLILPHAVNHREKYDFLKLMMRKLNKFQREECVVENCDTLDMQEVFTAGYFYVTLMRQCIEQFFETTKVQLFKHICGTAQRTKPPGVELIWQSDEGHWLAMNDFQKVVEKASFIGSNFNTTLATGKLRSSDK